MSTSHHRQGYTLNLFAQLQLESNAGAIAVYPYDSQNLIVECSGGKVFRHALRTLQTHFSLGELWGKLKQPRLLATNIEIRIRQKTLIGIQAGKGLQIAYLRLLPQLLLYWLKR